MSVSSSLPEWKQLLLERKRRDEEERERREKQEMEKLASMPAWKRGIIQRRKAKQDSLGDREKDKDVCLLQVDVRSPSDGGLSDTDSFVTLNWGGELSLSPDPGQWLDAEVKPGSEVSAETIVPVHENLFIRTQSSWKKGKEADAGSEPEAKEGEKDKTSPKGQDGEPGRGRDIGLKIERFRDFSDGREKEKSRNRSQGRERDKDKGQWKDLVKDSARERDFSKVRKDEEEKETDPSSRSFSPLGPCLRTIRADNIIIIEQDRNDEKRGRWRETEKERPEEDHQGKRGMKMDLREILAGGGSVTEIRASEVLIIKPPTSLEERNQTAAAGGGGGKGTSRDDGEMKGSIDGRRENMARELRTDLSWLREKEKERPWGQATVIKDDRKDSLDDNVFVDRGGRVSQLLSKFGEHPKFPSRSKSSDNFLRPGATKCLGEEDEQQSDADGRSAGGKGVPKRSFSFSDRVVCAKENGLSEDGGHERRTRERIHSEKSPAPGLDVTGLGKEAAARIKLCCSQLLDKNKFGKQRERLSKNEDEKGGLPSSNEVKKGEPIDIRAAEQPGDANGDEGFTVASVKNTEGISFARRVPIRQDGKARAEREAKRLTGEKSSEGEPSVEKDSEAGRQEDKKVSDLQREEGLESSVPPEKSSVTAASAESDSHAAESQSRHESAFTECPGPLGPGSDRTRDPHRAPEWSGTGPQGPYLAQSVLSQHTEDLITKIEKIGDTTVYSNEKGEKVYRAPHEATKDGKQEAQACSDARSAESAVHEVTQRSPKRIPPKGAPSSPLEIQIPRSVFYVAEELMEKIKGGGQGAEGQDWDEGKGLERRDSWRIGKPLSRIESLREKIRQRELERLKQREAQDGGGSDGAEITPAAEDGRDERGTEAEREWEAAVHVQKRPVEADREQEDVAAAAAQTTVAAFDVTQEVLKTCPQLPVPVPSSQAVRGEEVTSGYATAASEVLSGSFQLSEDDEDHDPVKHVEEQLRRHRDQHENREEREEEEEEEEEELSEEELEEYTSPLDPAQSLSPLPPHPNSLAAMSRIYNVEAVGSRSAVCLRERTVDVPPVHLVKVKPLLPNAQQGNSKAFPGEDMCAVQTIQRQIEQFQLKEQEVLKRPNSPLKDREAKGQQSPRGTLKQPKDDAKTQEKDHQTSNPKVSPQRVCSPTPQPKQSNQTFTTNSAVLRNQSPDNALKPLDSAPTPASSPSSLSPTPSPSISPSSTPSPTLFSIRSASGGKGKRGATITITPRKPAEVGGGGGGGGVMGSTKGSTAAGMAPAKNSSQQTQTTSTVAEPAKKKYPTVEEIEVIGGYQNLENSCLIKSRGTPKRGKVCFDEDQLEQVCEYPSETSMLAYTPCPHDLWRLQAEEAQDEEANPEGGATMVSKSARSVGIAMAQGLRVDESCPR